MGLLWFLGLIVVGVAVAVLIWVYPALWILGVVGIGVLCVLAIGVLIRQGGAAGYDEAHRNDKPDKPKAR